MVKIFICLYHWKVHYDVLSTLKRLGTPLWFFQNYIFYREIEALLFCDLILSWVISFRKISLKFLTSFRRYEGFLLNINHFYQFFGFFGISLSQRNCWRKDVTDDVRVFSINLQFFQKHEGGRKGVQIEKKSSLIRVEFCMSKYKRFILFFSFFKRNFKSSATNNFWTNTCFSSKFWQDG